VVPGEQLEQVRQWVENYQRMKQDLESISAINRELLRRKRPGSPKSSKKG
jgi:predicted CopG family antitoxin